MDKTISRAGDGLLRQAIQFFQAGELHRAEQIARKILGDQPQNFDVLHLLGVIKTVNGANDEAEYLYRKALDINGDHEELRVNLGLALIAGEKFEEALAHVETALSRNSGNAAAHLTRGNILRKLGRKNAALESFDRAVSIVPRYVKAWVNRGVALNELERYDDAVASCDKALGIDPGSAEAWSNRGIALGAMKRFGEALESYDRALRISPDSAEVWSNRGNALGELKRFDEALSSFDRALALDPRSAQVWSNRGNILGELRRYHEAISSFDKALGIDPRHGDACYNRGVALTELKRYDEALACYDRALATGTALPYCLGDWLHTRMMLCDWDGIEPGFEKVTAEIERGYPALAPFASLAMPITAGQQKKCAELFVRNNYGSVMSEAPLPVRRDGEKIRIGYFSSDFKPHAVSFLTVGMFEAHDRERFEIYGFGLERAKSDEMRSRVVAAFDRFFDLGTMDAAKAIAIARAAELDIAIDLNGHTSGSRTEIFGARVAPIQVNYIGHPGTMGAGFIDYIIGDPIVVPENQKAAFSEKIAYLPHTFQANDAQRPVSVPISRSRYGMRDEDFIFCCFNNSYKLTPEYFRVWLRLLARIDNSVLWLIGKCDSQVARLKSLAEKNGVSGSRILFADQVSYAEHIARYSVADLALDTSPFGGGTTTSDVLWAGLPVITVLGDTFASRMSASLLNAIGLPELVVASLDEYEALALELATNHARLSSLREKLIRQRTTAPLFDTGLFTKHIEGAYTKMWERRQAGLPPDHIYVAA